MGWCKDYVCAQRWETEIPIPIENLVVVATHNILINAAIPLVSKDWCRDIDMIELPRQLLPPGVPVHALV